VRTAGIFEHPPSPARGLILDKQTMEDKGDPWAYWAIAALVDLLVSLKI
jgi:hypothetical protein